MTLPANLTNPQGQGYHAEVDGTYVRLAATPVTPARLSTRPVSPPKIDTSTNPEDMVDDTGARFSRNNFLGGDGLLLAHRSNRELSDDQKYKSSEDLEVIHEDAGERATLVTLAQGNEILTSGLMGEATGNLAQPLGVGICITDQNPIELIYTASQPQGSVRVMVGDNTTLGATSWEANVITELPFGGQARITGLVYSNAAAYAINAVGQVARRTAAGWAPFSVAGGDLSGAIFTAKGRVLAGALGGALKEVVADPAPDVELVVGGGAWVG